MRMIVAAIIGVLAALCVVMGVLTAAELVPPIGKIDGLFWLALAGVLFIALMTGVVIKASQELLQLLG